MNAWFPNPEEESSFRVMFDDLSHSQIEKVKHELEAIPYVSSVGYEADSENYNKDKHTLYIVNTKCEYGTDEELSIQNALDNNFEAYQMQYSSNNVQGITVPIGLIALALGVMPLIFLALFVTFAVLQGNTGISFTEGNPDAIADIFPKDNTVVLIYNNKDEENTSGILSRLGDNKHITSMVGYHNTLGDERTAEDMSTAIVAMSDGVKIDKDMIKLLYYLCYSGKTLSVTAENSISFIKNDVMSNGQLSGYIDDGMNEYIDYLD